MLYGLEWREGVDEGAATFTAQALGLLSMSVVTVLDEFAGERIAGLVGGWMDGWVDGGMGGWMNKITVNA